MSKKPNPARKPNSNSRLKNIPEEQQLLIENWCGEDGLVAAVSRCASELSLVTSKSRLSIWLKWRKDVAPLKAKFDAAEADSKAATELLKQIDPKASAEKLQAFGQLMFMQKAMQAENTEDFVSIGRLNLAKLELEAKVNGFKARYEQKERELKLDMEKWQATLRTKIEQGLEALRAELAGNAQAEAIFRQLTEALRA
jgi:hypothetical protein